MRGYEISVTPVGDILINGRAVDVKGSTEDNLARVVQQLNSALQSGAIKPPLRLSLADERPDGIGSKEIVVEPGDRVHGWFLEASEAAQAALVSRAPWGRSGPIRGGLIESSITRSAASSAPVSQKSSSRKVVEAREARRRKFIAIGIAVVVLGVGARVALTTEWTPPSYAGVCVDTRTDLRAQKTTFCESSNDFFAWRYVARDGVAPAVDESAAGALVAVPEAEASRAVINTKIPADGGTVGGDGRIVSELAS